MAKYSYEFKMKVIQEHLSGKGSYEYLARKYNIASSTTVNECLLSYKKFGKEGILPSRQKITTLFNLSFLW